MGTHRTDAHRPAALVTEDYEYVFAAMNQVEGGPGWVLRMGDYGLQMSRWISRTDYLGRGTHQCHHCGAHLNYFAVLEHLPTGDAVVVGETCLANRFDRASNDFHALRKAAQLDREAHRIRTAVAKFVEANPDLAFMADPKAEHTNEFTRDVARKLRQYGTLSERQITAVRRSLVRDAERAARLAAEALEPREVVPTGRQQVSGTVLSLKTKEGDYGASLKMLVKDARGFKIWGTVPSAISPQVGDTVAFTATLEASNDDEYFGFANRPSKASIVEGGASTVEG